MLNNQLERLRWTTGAAAALGSLASGAFVWFMVNPSNSLWVLGVVLALAISVGFILSQLVGRGIHGFLAPITAHANKIASGDGSGDVLPCEPRSTATLEQLKHAVNGISQSMEQLRQEVSAREELDSLEKRAHAISNAAVDGIITMDERGTILSINPAGEAMFGYRADELVGKNVKMLAPSPHREQHDAYLRRYVSTGVARIIGAGRELQGVRRDGSLIDIWLRVAESNLDGTRYFIGTVQDISDRRQTQEAVHEAAQRLATAIQEILATTSQQAAGTTQQAAAVSETTTTVDQLRQSAEQAARRSDEMAAAAQRTGQVGTAGEEAIEQSIEAMSQVREEVESLAESILSLAERAQMIGDITATVNDIAEQTNVLALNAAVEAARAGEHGKGFAVVASEVKQLAEEAKKATAQVRRILGEIQKATHSAVLSTEQGTRAVGRANEVVGRAGETIRTLTKTIKDSAQTATQISASASQQAIGVNQLNEGMRNIDKVTKENVLAIRQIEGAAQNLTTLSSELASLTATES